MSTTFNRKNVTTVLTTYLTNVGSQYLSIDADSDDKDEDHIAMLNSFIEEAVKGVMTLKVPVAAVKRAGSSGSSGKKSRKGKGNSYSKFYGRVAATAKGNDDVTMDFTFQDRKSTTTKKRTLEIFSYINENKETFSEFTTGTLKELLDYLSANLPDGCSLMHKTSVMWTQYLTDDQRASFKPPADDE